MSQPDAPPIEVARVREVVGIADSRDAFDRIVEALLLAGVDRARISLMGSREAILDKLHHYYVEPTALAEVDQLPRRDLVTRDDAAALNVLVFGTLLAVATLGAGAIVVASGGAAAALGRGPTRNGACGICGQALLRKGFGSEAMAAAFSASWSAL